MRLAALYTAVSARVQVVSRVECYCAQPCRPFALPHSLVSPVMFFIMSGAEVLLPSSTSLTVSVFVVGAFVELLTVFARFLNRVLDYNADVWGDLLEALNPLIEPKIAWDSECAPPWISL